MSQIPTSSVSTAKHNSRSRRKTLSHADLKDFLCDLQEDEVEVKMVVVNEDNSNGGSSSSCVGVVDIDLLRDRQPPIEMTDEQRIRDMYKLLKGNHQPRYPQDAAYDTACQLAREILAHSKYSIFPTRALYPEKFDYRPETLESKKQLLGSLTPMIGDAEKQRQYDTKESEAFTRCRVNRSKTNRLSCFEYTDLDTGFVITPEEYEKRYMSHLAVIRGQQEAMKQEILLKKQQQEQQQQQAHLLQLQQQQSSSGSNGPLTDTHNTIILTNHANQMEGLEKHTLKVVSVVQQTRTIDHENVDAENGAKTMVTTTTIASTTTTLSPPSSLVVHVVDAPFLQQQQLQLQIDETSASSAPLSPQEMDANDLSTYGDDSVVMTDDDTGFSVGPRRRQRASILLTSFDSPLGSPMTKTQPLSSSSSVDIASVLRIVSVEVESHNNATTSAATATATLQPTIVTTELTADDDDDAIPMSFSPLAENTLLSRLQVSSSRRETLSPASVRSMMFESMDQQQQQQEQQQEQDPSAAADDDYEAELLVIACTTDRSVDGGRGLGQGLGQGLGTAVDLSGVDVKGTEDMDLLSNAISTGRNYATLPPVVQVVPVTHTGPGLVDEVGVASAGGGAEEWIMDEDEGGFDDALLLRKHAWRTEFRSLSTLPCSGDDTVSTSMAPAVASGPGLATVTPVLTGDQVMSSEDQQQAMIFGSELDALLASSDESPRDDDDRHDRVVNGHMVDGHMVESGLDVLLSSSGGEDTNTNVSRDHGEGVHLGMGGSSSGGGGAAVVTMIPQQQQQQQQQQEQQQQQQEEGAGTGEEDAAYEEMKQDYQPQQQQIEGRNTDRSPGMVEVDGSDVDMVVVAGDDSARTDQPRSYPVSSSLHTAVQAVPQGAFDVNPFASTQHAPVTEGTSKPGFSQRFATFRQGLIIHTNGAFSAPMVYPPVANAPGGVGVVVDNGLAAIGNGNTVIGGDTTVATSTTVPTPFAIDEGGGNQGGDSATKRKEGGVCESDSATKKSKITGSTHCSSPTNGPCGIMMTSVSTNFTDAFSGEIMGGRGIEGLPQPPTTTQDAVYTRPSEGEDEQEEGSCMMVDPVEAPAVTDVTAHDSHSSRGIGSRGSIRGSGSGSGSVSTATGGRLPTATSSLSLSSLAMTDMEEAERRASARLVVRQQVAYWKYRWEVCSQYAAAQALALVHGRPSTQPTNDNSASETGTSARTVSPEVLPQSHDTSLVISSSMVCSNDHPMCVDKDSVDQDSVDKSSMDQDRNSQMGVMMTDADHQDGDGVGTLEGGCNESKHSRH